MSDRNISSEDGKQALGRGGFRRPMNDHTGHRSDPTYWGAASHEPKPPTKLEMLVLFTANPVSVKTYRAAGLNDQQIYNILAHSG